MCVGNHVYKNLQEILSHGEWEQCSAVHTIDLGSENISKSASMKNFLFLRKYVTFRVVYLISI